MPLRLVAENAATWSARVGGLVDDAAADHVENGTPLPDIDELERLLVGIITAGAADVVDEVAPLADPDTVSSDDTVTDIAAAVVVALLPVIRAAYRQAKIERRRRRAQRDVAANVTTGIAARAAQSTARAGAPAVDPVSSSTSRPAGQRPVVRRVAPRVRMIVRTELAARRNDVAADEADRRNVAVFIRDARLGDTDEACERVDGRYATPGWLRRNRVEHPNCTRLGTPVQLPDGETVTLR